MSKRFLMINITLFCFAIGLASLVHSNSQLELLDQAHKLEKKGAYAEAVTIMKKVIRLAPKNHSNLAYTSQIMREASLYEEGLQHALAAIEINPNIAWYHASAALNAYYTQEEGQAIKYARSFMAFERELLEDENYKKVGELLAELTAEIDPLIYNQASSLYKAAKATFLKSQQYYSNGHYDLAKEALDALWASYPIGDPEWGKSKHRIPGDNIGNPPFYAGLRVMTDIVNWKVSKKPEVQDTLQAHEIILKIVLIGKSEGIQPNSWHEFNNLTGQKVQKTLHPALLEDNYGLIRESLEVFKEYIRAITRDKLSVKLEFLYLSDLKAQFSLKKQNTTRRDGINISLSNWSEVWKAISQKHKMSTDWWWFIYPSLIPNQKWDFKNPQFVQAGIKLGINQEPVILEDDISLINKRSNRAGGAAFSTLGRKAYITLFMQHEFFHYLFLWAYPEFGLEKTSHQWHDRKNWPSDFEGRYEADYYHEALTKRLLNADPPLEVKFKYRRGTSKLFKKLTADKIEGNYRHTPMKSGWHAGKIELRSEGFVWTNQAGISWRLIPDWDVGLLRIDSKSPYNKKFPAYGPIFSLILAKDDKGNFLSKISGYSFNGKFYQREP